MRRNFTSVLLHSEICSVKVPGMLAAPITEVIVKVVVVRPTVALPLTVHVAESSDRPAGRAGWMLQLDSSRIVGRMFTSW